MGLLYNFFFVMMDIFMKYLKNKNEFVVYIYMYRFLNYFLIIYKEMSDNK